MITLPHLSISAQVEVYLIFRHYYCVITYKKLGKLGRLGNQLFQYAGARLYAELNGFDWAFPPWIGDRIFNMRPKPLGLRRLFLPTVQLEDMGSTNWSERLLRPFGLWQRGTMNQLYSHPRDAISLYGYLQDETSLSKLREHKSRVQSWFRFKPEIDESFRAATKGISWVGMHVRRGDYARPGLIIPMQTYLDTLTRIRDNLPVYLASDDPAARYELDPNILLDIHNPLPDLYACAPGDLFDFWMLQHATIIIGGGSVFSWWAAFLSENCEYYAPPLTRFWPRPHVAPPPFVRQQI